MATDEWLRVEGCDNVYALGDCATINQRKVMVSAPFRFVWLMFSVSFVFMPINSSVRCIMVFYILVTWVHALLLCNLSTSFFP